MMPAIQWKASAPVPLRQRPARVAKPIPSAPNLDRLRSALAAIPDGHDALETYGPWFNVICGIHYETGGGEEGRDIAHEFSSRSANKYDPDVLNAKWESLKTDHSNPVTANSILAVARSLGWIEPIDDLFQVLPDQQQTPGRFVPVRAFEFAAKPSVAWIVKRVLPMAALGVIFGDSGSGKTFFAFDLASAVARGIEWNGRKTRKGRVVVVVAEGAEGFRSRVKAYLRQYGISESDYPLEVIGDAPNLLLATDAKELIAGISKSGPASMVVIDTLAATTPGGNESSSEDMGKAIGHCKALHKATGALVLLVHHSGKDASKGARGWSGLKAAVDVEIEITRSGNDRVATVTKLKDGEDGEKFGFRLLPVSIGMDEDGDVITSCVVQYDQAAAARVKQKAAGKGRHQRDVLAALTELQQGEELPDFNTVVEDAVARDDPPEQGKTDRRRGYKIRALDQLIESGRIELVGQRVRFST